MAKHFKIICLLLIFVLLLNSCVSVKKPSESNQKENVYYYSYEPPADTQRIKAVWLNFEEISSLAYRQDEEGFRKNVENAMKSISETGFNRVIVHVRAFSDAFYKSSLFPSSKYLSGTQGVYPGFDALEIFCEYAHKYALKIDAWINPYRVSYDTNPEHLSRDNPAYGFIHTPENSRNVLLLDNGIFYNPASSQARRLILDGVREIIDGYNVDGIHFDDYFYPTTDASADAPEYESYKSSGGLLSQDDWRRENVNALISETYSLIKGKSKQLLFSVSPSGDIDKNYSEHYADVGLWCREYGYIDVIMPQLYYGFENSVLPFESTLDRWLSLVSAGRVQICIGLAMYKCGEPDAYAGTGSEEWTHYTNIIQRQLFMIRIKNSNCGFALYSYSHIFGDVRNDIKRAELKAAEGEIKN